MTYRRRNFLIGWLVSMLALLAVAVPLASALPPSDPAGLPDRTSISESKLDPRRPPLAWEVGSTAPWHAHRSRELDADRVGWPGCRAGVHAGRGLPRFVVPEQPAPTTAPDAIDRIIGGNAPLVTPAIDLRPFPDLQPVPEPQPFPDLRPFPNLQAPSADSPIVGIAPDRTPVTPVAELTSGGFNWSDAAIGFSVAALLALLAAGMIMILRNRDGVAAGTS